MDYNYYVRDTQFGYSNAGNILWAKSGQTLKGVGYAMDVENRIDDTLVYNAIVKKIGLEETTFSIKYDTHQKAFKKSFIISMDHPSDSSKQAYFEVRNHKRWNLF